MVLKVICISVILVLILLELKDIGVDGQQQIGEQQQSDGIEDLNDDSSGESDMPKALQLKSPDSSGSPDDISVEQLNDRQQRQDNWTGGQEPMRRRRRPGARKRKRRPFGQNGPPQQPLDGSFNQQYYKGHVQDDAEALRERDGVFVTVDTPTNNFNNPNWQTDSSRKVPLRNWNKQNGFHDQPPMPDGFQDEKATRPVLKQNSKQFEEINKDKSYRKPYSEAKKEDRPATDGAIDIKNLLKQSGGLSLSEILQQKNLSLDDLLKGKQTAIKALQNPSIEVVNPTKPTARRIPNLSRPVSMAVSATQKEPGRRHQFSSTDEDNYGVTNPPRRIPSFAKPKNVEVPTISAPAPTILTTGDDNVVITMSSYLIPPKPVQVSADETIFTTSEPEPVEIITIGNREPFVPQVRRLPPPSLAGEKSKPIKEVVSGFRPDLNNLNTRKRLSPIKLKSTNGNVGGTATTARPPRYGNSFRLGQSSAMENIVSKANEVAETNFITTTTQQPPTTQPTQPTSTNTTSQSPDIIKDIVKSRLALRPRLRLPHIDTAALTTTPTALPSTPTTITTTTTTTAVPPNESEDDESENYPTVFPTETDDSVVTIPSYHVDSIKDILDKSEPQINAIETFATYEETKSKDVTPIEELFENVFNIEEDEAALEELLEAEGAVTVRSDDKPVKRPADTDVTERNPSLFTDITSAKTIDDRTDILELLGDRRSGARLVKVLAQRNMTLDELIEHRQRGSSQLHLAEIYNNKTKPISDTANVSAEKLDIVTAFENFPSFNLNNLKSVKPDEIKTDSQGSSYFTSIINIKPTDEIYKEGRALRDPVVEQKKPPTTKKPRKEYFPQWKSMSFASSYESPEDTDTNFIDIAPPKTPLISQSSRMLPSEEDVSDVELIEDEVARAHDFVDLELSGHGFKRNSVMIENAQIPIGVRSAIIASASIVAVSLLIFIIIFVMCRWRQKRKKKFNYSENFQAVRSRLPILSSARDSTSSSKRSTSPPNVIYPGSLRHSGSNNNSKLNTMDPNSKEVQEYLYDAMRKPFQ